MRSILSLTIAMTAMAAAPLAAQVTAPLATPAPMAVEAQSRSATPLTAADLDAWLDGYMPYALKTGDIAGAQLVVVKDGAVLTSRGFGYSDAEAREPVDPAMTLFRLGSVGKLFTWTAVMQQVEQGKIDLDADINAYLDFKIPERDGKPVTMRNLMQHTPGFEESFRNGGTTNPEAAISTEQWLKDWTPKRVFEAGVTPAYSNYGASLAGYIVERVSGEPFDDYLERHIFGPLEMRRSTFRQPLPDDLAPSMSKGYALASGDPKDFEIFNMAPAGSMSSTADDMAKFMIAFLQDGEFNGKRILRPETVEMMHNSPLTLLPPLNRMELGFFETGINGRKITGHHGDTQLFHTSLHLLRDEGVGFYVSFNSTGKAGVSGDLRTALFDDFADRYFPGEGVDGRVDAGTAAEHAKMMAGNWVLSRGSASNFMNVIELFSQFTISVGPEGELVVPYLGLNGKPRDWVEIAPFVWRDVGGHQRLAAQVEGGKPVRFSFDLVSPFMVWDRAPWYKNTAILLPLFGASLAALALTLILWPVVAIVRWRHKSSLALEPRALGAYRRSRLAALAIILGMAGWVGALAVLTLDSDAASSASDPMFWFVQIFGAVAFIGGALLLLRSLQVVWTGKRSWFAKLWSLVLAASALSVLYVAFAFKLIGFGVNY